MADFNIEDQAALHRTQDIRSQLMTDCMSKGIKELSLEEKEFLLKTADSSDKQILTRKRLTTEDKAADAQKQIAELTSKMLIQRHKREMQKASPGEQDVGNISPSNVVPGQTSIGAEAFSYDTFMSGDGTALPKNT